MTNLYNNDIKNIIVFQQLSLVCKLSVARQKSYRAQIRKKNDFKFQMFLIRQNFNLRSPSCGQIPARSSHKDAI